MELTDKTASIALSRALHELRCGRAIKIDNRAFLSAEFVGKADGSSNDSLSITLLKRAGVLPQIALANSSDDSLLSFSADELQHGLTAEAEILLQGETARLPLKTAEDARIVTFRAGVNGTEHLAILIGQPEAQKAPLTRLHSSCITGDLLGSLRCDCGDQLHMALAQMAEAKHGILLYLQQEGRGIGISNKIRAYKLQDAGADTLEANEMLGFAGDERDFSIAAAMLKCLKIETVTLLSNNPDKVAQLQKSGIKIASRQPLSPPENPHNAGYLATKIAKFGHQFAAN